MPWAQSAADPSPVKNKRVLVLGAGGVARPIVYGLRSRGALVTVASRTKQRSEKLAKSFDCKAIDWDSRQRALCDVVVNCTPIGMHPNVDESPLSKTFLKPSILVFDTVYNPESTLLIKEARERNCQAITGVDMFERQAELHLKTVYQAGRTRRTHARSTQESHRSHWRCEMNRVEGQETRVLSTRYSVLGSCTP